MKECEECGDYFEERGDWQRYCYPCYLKLKDSGDLNSSSDDEDIEPFDKECERCGDIFEAKGDWQTYCKKCFREMKKEELASLHSQIEMLRNRLEGIQRSGTGNLSELDEKFLTNLIKLCHPDHHQNSKLSNDVTATLLKLKKKK